MTCYPFETLFFRRSHLNLYTILRQILLKEFVYNRFYDYYLYITKPFWNQTFFHAFSKLEKFRNDSGLPKKDYVLCLKKYYKRYNELPTIFKVEPFEVAIFQNFLLDSIYLMVHKNESGLNITDFDSFQWAKPPFFSCYE